MGQRPKNQLVKGLRDKMRYKIPIPIAIAIEREREREKQFKRTMKKEVRIKQQDGDWEDDEIKDTCYCVTPLLLKQRAVPFYDDNKGGDY